MEWNPSGGDVVERWCSRTAYPPFTAGIAHHSNVRQGGYLRYGHSKRNRTGTVWNSPLRRKQHSGAGGVVGDQGDWMGMGMERMKVPNRGTSSGRLRDRNSEGESRSLWLLTHVPL